MRPADVARFREALDEVLTLRADRQATVRTVIADLTEQKLAATTEPVTAPGYPEPDSYPVREILQTLLSEEWEHACTPNETWTP
jgi:hypothetical protein